MAEYITGQDHHDDTVTALIVDTTILCERCGNPLPAPQTIAGITHITPCENCLLEIRQEWEANCEECESWDSGYDAGLDEGNKYDDVHDALNEICEKFEFTGDLKEIHNFMDKEVWPDY